MFKYSYDALVYFGEDVEKKRLESGQIRLWRHPFRPSYAVRALRGRTSSADATLQTAGAAAYGQPAGLWPVPVGASPKQKIPRGAGEESPDSFDNTPKKPENYVSVFSREVERQYLLCQKNNRLTTNLCAALMY
jgi:hypothetical protein